MLHETSGPLCLSKCRDHTHIPERRKTNHVPAGPNEPRKARPYPLSLDAREYVTRPMTAFLLHLIIYMAMKVALVGLWSNMKREHGSTQGAMAERLQSMDLTAPVLVPCVRCGDKILGRESGCINKMGFRRTWCSLVHLHRRPHVVRISKQAFHIYDMARTRPWTFAKTELLLIVDDAQTMLGIPL